MKYRDFSARLAADGDTWGIEGPTFLICYLVVAVLAIIVVLGIRHSATRGLFDSRSGRALDSEHIGYLAGFGARHTSRLWPRCGRWGWLIRWDLA